MQRRSVRRFVCSTNPPGSSAVLHRTVLRGTRPRTSSTPTPRRLRSCRCCRCSPSCAPWWSCAGLHGRCFACVSCSWRSAWRNQTAPRLRSGHGFPSPRNQAFGSFRWCSGWRSCFLVCVSSWSRSPRISCWFDRSPLSSVGPWCCSVAFRCLPPLKPSTNCVLTSKPHPQKVSQTSSSLSSKSPLLLSPSGGCSSTRGLFPRWPSFSWFLG